ncbi:unnamed protein product [Rotaria socialis]|uniref:HAT C-terminal dimerisation domain-containing protein n=1 Tax=Rotaria socialis TaxID=392032 RepID=A0A817X1Q3_9BILA|nr:unnamed protein product [Rotaria socialis]CAF3362540.1 unnamed protein product [Rotaria socialis]CAF4412129.1 unnamed protein product [Rotaria socialis]CAF4823522.1 unnamed protein product [Rotaria socialis]
MAAVKLKEYFEFSIVSDNRMNGICKLCNHSYKDLYGIYSNFTKHLKRKHASDYQKCFSSSVEEDLLDTINLYCDKTTPLGLNDTASKENRINLSITKNLIIKCNSPLSIIEKAAFREFMKECVPKWEPMSVKKLKHIITNSFKERVHKLIHDTLQHIESVSLTIDGWSDRCGRAFLGITCHFIDEKLLPQAYLIEFTRMKSPHTSDNIRRQTEYVLDSFNIKEKIFRIITDNAASMVKAYKFGLSTQSEQECFSSHNGIDISDGDTKSDACDDDFNFTDFQFFNIQHDGIINNVEDGSPIRISCFAHTLQLSVRDGLEKLSQISKLLEKCRILARCSQKSTKIADILDQIQKHFEQTTVTRWNSEFMLIRSVLSINKEDLEAIADTMENPVRFSNSDFKIMEEIINILEPFHQISLKCQAEKVATASLVVPSIVHLLSHLQSFKEILPVCQKLTQQLQYSIERRFAGIVKRLKLTNTTDTDPFNDPLYFMASVLDPAFKFFWIYDLELPTSDENRLKQSIIQLIIDEVSKNSRVLSNEKAESIDLTDSSTINSWSPMIRMSPFKRRKLFVYDNYQCNKKNPNNLKTLEPSRELEIYLNDPVQSSFSEYWRQSQLTALKTLVIRLFSVQASSAPIERVFSHAGIIFSSRRTRLSEQLFKDLVFLKVNQSLL